MKPTLTVVGSGYQLCSCNATNSRLRTVKSPKWLTESRTTLPETCLVTLDNIAGNHLTLQILPNRYVTYAHLQKGSVNVKFHDRFAEARCSRC